MHSVGASGRPGRTLAENLDQAGAVMVVRDDHSVAAHYGSAAAELTVCVTGAGVAVRSDLDVLELDGDAAWLDRALQDALGVPALLPGSAVRAATAWCCLVESERALVIGTPVEIARCMRLAQQQAIRVGHSIGHADRSAATTALTLVGPRASALLARAGLPGDLPVASVRACSLPSGPAVLLRESAARFLLLVAEDRAADAWRELFAVGRPLGLSFVGLEALERLAAADRASLPVD